MSIDLEWNKLDPSLATHLVDILNRHLENAERPSFIGPIEILSLDFGTAPPDVELVDLRDIFRDFLEDDDDEHHGEAAKVPEGVEEDEEGFEWVSRRTAGGEEPFDYRPLPPYGSASMFASPPTLNPSMHTWSPGMSLPSLPEYRYSWPHVPMYRSPSPATPFYAHSINDPEMYSHDDVHPELDSPSELHQSVDPHLQQQHYTPTHRSSPQPQPSPGAGQHPNLQVHLHVNWHSDLRITLTTSLLINYPSRMFMSLPIKLSVTGLIFNGELAVAYEGERRRVHLCILDDLDPYGPAGDRSKREQQHIPNTFGANDGLTSDHDDESPSGSGIDIGIGIGIRPVGNLSSGSGGGDARFSKPLPVGQRLLPSIFIESEIGQADKHVLKNVTRVERFIQDVIRKTVEEELVFPNFHTLILGEPSQT